MHSPRLSKHGGGVATVFSNHFLCSKVEFSLFSSFEYVAVTLRSPNDTPALFVTIYHPPKHNSNFLPEFSEFLSHLCTKFDDSIIIGDLDQPKNSKALEFLNLIDS